MSDARNVRCVPILYRPNNRIVLGLECRHYMIRVILNDIIRNWAALSLAFWTGLHEYNCHSDAPFFATSGGLRGLPDGAMRSRIRAVVDCRNSPLSYDAGRQDRLFVPAYVQNSTQDHRGDA
jgi:hypothetical protein